MNKESMQPRADLAVTFSAKKACAYGPAVRLFDAARVGQMSIAISSKKPTPVWGSAAKPSPVLVRQ